MTREHDAAQQHEIYWEAFARSLTPTAADAARVREGLQRRLAQLRPVEDAPAIATPEPAARERPRAAAAAVVFAKSTALSVGIAVTALGGLHLGARALAPTPAELPTTSSSVASDAAPETASRHGGGTTTPASTPTAAPTSTTIVAPEPAPQSTTTARASTTASPRSGTRTTGSDTPAHEPALAPADALRQELALIRRAREAIAAGRHADADAALAEHARSFPAGALAPERAAYEAIVACHLHRGDATSRAREFARAHPTATLLGEVKAACE